MKVVCVMVACISLAVFLVYVVSVHRKKSLAAAEVEHMASNEVVGYALPRTIWVYWDNREAPDFIKQNVEHWRKSLPTWDIQMLSKEDVVAVLPKHLETLSVQHQSDWLRLYLLKEHGGVWIDAGIVLNSQDALDGLYNESILESSEWTGFRLGDKLENWFIMAPRGSQVIRDWFDEYNRAIEFGFHKYRKEIEREGIDTSDIFTEDNDVYLTQHACLRAVLMRYDVKPVMVVKDAGESMFKIHVGCEWKKECILERLSQSDAKEIPFIKMRGADRP